MIAPADIARAAAALADGRLVAFPTETVYGLGADAASEAAVRRVFAAKGRPPSHPLIVHLPAGASLDAVARDVPPLARRLAERFWPGPLTLVLRRAPHVIDAVTGGLDTVAIRVPAHDDALALLAAFGRGIAAPSANRFGTVSPTTAAHVHADLGTHVDIVLDGGPCRVGVESTIVDLSTEDGPFLLRPGGLSLEELEDCAEIRIPAPPSGTGPGTGVRVPGSLPSHYAPRCEVVLLDEKAWPERARALLDAGRSVGALATGGSHALPEGVLLIPLPHEPAAAAARLYSALREADALRLDVLLAAPFPEAGLGLALDDRLRRAAGPRPTFAGSTSRDTSRLDMGT